MNDKAIRAILISYLQATNHEIRIYQEKNIGASICDVMAVTDKLTGYEIKSDLDNYHRLEEQVKAYDRFFDENFLVVSARHSQSAAEKIPGYWGILCVHEDRITVQRQAKKNPLVQRRSQLSVLWKLELKNLLIQNQMPLFAQKEKGYIAQQLAAAVPEERLGQQIARELMDRDYSVFEAEDYTVYSRGGDGFPAEEIVDMLSERNLQELTLDKWIALYRQATAVQEQKQVLFQAPVERVAHAISYKDIQVSLGVPWVGKEIVGEFMCHLIQVARNYKDCVDYEPVTGNWSIRHKTFLARNNTNAEVKYGLPRCNALQILEATLNLREIKLFDSGTVYNEKDTLAALEKQRLIQEEFQRWIWLDEDRRWLVEDAYNQLFAPYELQKYDGSGLQFPDMAEAFALFDYQKDAVQKILTTPNTLLAFDVGAGKTFIMIAAAMKMRAEGISRKNLFVVPNHIVGQWEKIFTDLYPKAKVLAVEPKSFKPAMRQKVLTQIRDGDYDGVIMAYSCFEMIPLSEATVIANMEHHLQRLDQALDSLRQSGRHWDWAGKFRQEKQYFTKLAQELLDSMTQLQTGDITFRDLEINTLFVDEAHNYKNLPIRTKLKNLNGINTKGSTKCLDLLHKVRQVQTANGGRGVVFATGTPLCNSISDAYAMQMYLQYEELEKTHLDVFDNWVKTFALPEQLCEIDVDTSKFRFVRKFSKFFNLPELSRMFAQIAIFHAVNSPEDLPVLEGYTDQVIKKYPELTAYMGELCQRTEDIRSKRVSRHYDNMLKVSTDGRKAALHLQLVGRKQPMGEQSKLCLCAENVVTLYGKYPNATQLIFCDYSTPKGAAFNVYDEIKALLMEKGIPEKEIAFIHHYQTESRKLELFRKFNAGQMRILIGSTFKLGIGANVQVKLKAIHHLDVPWRPADMVQREGRILRRGNENKDVLIYRYIAEGSFDSYSWQILETKQRFITQFLSGSTYQRSITDLEGDVLTYAQVKALALAEPLMKQLAEKENEIKNLRIILSQQKQTADDLRQELSQMDGKIVTARKRWTTSLTAVGHLKKYDLEAHKKMYQNIKELLTPELLSGVGMVTELPRIFGFRLRFPSSQDPKKPCLFLEYLEQRYTVEMGETPNGNARRVLNALQAFHNYADKDKAHLDKLVARKREISDLLENPDNTYGERLIKCEEEAACLRELIASRKDTKNEDYFY